MSRVLALSLGLIMVTTSGYANDRIRVRSQCSSCNTAIVQPFVKQSAIYNHAIVNNVVGVPVPVQYANPIAVQGATIYGYQQNLAAYTAPPDIGLLYNQAARLADQAQQLAGQAAMDFSSLVHAEGQYRTEVAKILAQSQRCNECVVEQPSQLREFSFKVTPKSDGTVVVEPMTELQDSFKLLSPSKNMKSVKPEVMSNADQLVSNILTNKCVKCHNNEKSSGNLNLLAPITDAQQQRILDVVDTDDKNILMPRKADGSAGDKLSQDEIAILRKVMLQ